MVEKTLTVFVYDEVRVNRTRSPIRRYPKQVRTWNVSASEMPSQVVSQWCEYLGRAPDGRMSVSFYRSRFESGFLFV